MNVFSTGQAVMVQTYVHMRRHRLSPSIALVFLVLAFFLQTIYASSMARIHLWKSSSLAVSAHGLDDKSRAELLRSEDSPAAEERYADRFLVALDEAGTHTYL